MRRTELGVISTFYYTLLNAEFLCFLNQFKQQKCQNGPQLYFYFQKIPVSLNTKTKTKLC